MGMADALVQYGRVERLYIDIPSRRVFIKFTDQVSALRVSLPTLLPCFLAVFSPWLPNLVTL